jgi:hypothetical protein
VSLERITNALNQGGAHLGDIVYWTLTDARLDRSTLETIWSAAQLAPEFMPEPPTAEKAFKTAAREAALGRPDRLVRLTLENEAEIVFAVVSPPTSEGTRSTDITGAHEPTRWHRGTRVPCPHRSVAQVGPLGAAG